MPFALGQRIDHYEFVDVLRSSQSSVVYKVRNHAAERFESLKILPGDLQNDQERVERFLREIKIHASLSHPNILTFYGACELANHLVMTTELVDGVALEERLEVGRLPWWRAIDYAGQALAALAYAHSQGVIHREIRPANIIVTAEGSIKLTGFSLARILNDPRLTLTGAMLGPLHYMSPEQVRSEEDVDVRTDIYSLGCVLYEMVTGRRPFESKSQFEVMLAHVNQAPAPPSSLVQGLPAEVEALILKALAKDPAHRYQSAEQFRAALESPQQWEVQRVAELSRPAPAAEPAAEPAHEILPVPEWPADADRRAFLVLACVLALIAVFTLIGAAATK